MALSKLFGKQRCIEHTPVYSQKTGVSRCLSKPNTERTRAQKIKLYSCYAVELSIYLAIGYLALLGLHTLFAG